MEKYIVNGGKRLQGSIKIEGAKNAVLPLLACSTIVDGITVFNNCPNILDVQNMLLILNSLNVHTRYYNESIVIDSSDINSYSIPCFLMRELRSSIFMLGALLARQKKAEVYSPGGCNIGARPIDIHIDALRSLGVKIIEEDDRIYCITNGCAGGKVRLKYPSVGATENVMMFSCIGDCTTIIENPAKEPEVVDLADFINSCGGKVFGAGSDCIVIKGVKKLRAVQYTPISDRIEAGTYAVATLICGGEVELSGFKSKENKNIQSFVKKFCNNTCKIYIRDDIIIIKSGDLGKGLNIKTGPYPMFPTDMQPQATALACYVNGRSKITETVFENRFNYVTELKKLGADIQVKGRTAFVNGNAVLRGGEVFVPDLRGGASLVLASLGIQEQTLVNGISIIKRGYLDFDKKLKMLGADIKYVKG